MACAAHKTKIKKKINYETSVVTQEFLKLLNSTIKTDVKDGRE
jgi:hypothetical protein